MEQSVTHTEMGIVTAALLSSVKLKEETKKSFIFFYISFFISQNYNRGIMKHHDQAEDKTSMFIGNKLNLTKG